MARFLFVTQMAHPWGGVETWLEELAGGLSEHHEVILGLVRGRRFHDPDRYRAARTRQLPSIEIAANTGTPEGRRRALAKAIESNRLSERALIHVSGMHRERVEYVWYGVPRALQAPSFEHDGPLRLVFLDVSNRSRKGCARAFRANARIL